jgi:hypothetical protein
MNRSHYQDAVRYMSVHSGTHRDLAAHRRTQRDNGKTARDAGYPQATGRLRWWWQVLGSNQRRLSRRFYSEPNTPCPHGR